MSPSSSTSQDSSRLPILTSRDIHLRQRLALTLRSVLARVKLHEHGPVGLQFLSWDLQSKVIQVQELQFEVVQFNEGESADLLSDNVLVKLHRSDGGIYMPLHI